MDSEKEKEAILKKLGLLGEVRKLHEWTVFGQKEADEMERKEEEIESEVPDSKAEPPQGEG